MRHYRHLTTEKQDALFYVKPMEFTKSTPKSELAVALGATMYTPATNKSIAKNLIQQKYSSLTSNVLCLEDAIGDHEVEEAEVNLLEQLEEVNEAVENGTLSVNDLPLLFIRVRSPEQLNRLLRKHGNRMHLITGFNLPKFTSQNATSYLEPIVLANTTYNENFYALPILETPEIIYIETRMQELCIIKQVIESFSDIILNIRLGGTDFSSLFGIRRKVTNTIYDIGVIQDVLIAIANLFSRASENYTLSGVVWEYFPPKNTASAALEKSVEIEGLLREVHLDKENNFIGKTVIHPSHINYVNALQAVTYVEYMDAQDILNHPNAGVLKGQSGNKMNEIKPHHNWALKIIAKSKVYGVLNEHAKYNDLF